MKMSELGLRTEYRVPVVFATMKFLGAIALGHSDDAVEAFEVNQYVL